MKKLALIFVVILAGCTKPNESTAALEAAGYKNIQITGYAFWGCDKNDTFSTGFTATGQNGKRISGVVCSGILKGSTIRTD